MMGDWAWQEPQRQWGRVDGQGQPEGCYRESSHRMGPELDVSW